MSAPLRTRGTPICLLRLDLAYRGDLLVALSRRAQEAEASQGKADGELHCLTDGIDARSTWPPATRPPARDALAAAAPIR